MNQLWTYQEKKERKKTVKQKRALYGLQKTKKKKKEEEDVKEKKSLFKSQENQNVWQKKKQQL